MADRPVLLIPATPIPRDGGPEADWQAVLALVQWADGHLACGAVYELAVPAGITS